LEWLFPETNPDSRLGEAGFSQVRLISAKTDNSPVCPLMLHAGKPRNRVQKIAQILAQQVRCPNNWRLICGLAG
jgi:hypothetical protein